MRFSKFDNTKYGSAHDLVEQISKNVPSHVQINTLKDTFPNGKVKGDVFYIGSLRGEEGDSLRIDINPQSNNFMRGQDFNGGVGVGGIVKILMEARSLRLPEIQKMFGSYLNQPVPVKQNVAVNMPVVTKPKVNITSEHTGEWIYKGRNNEILCTVRRYDVNGKKEFRPFIPDVNYPKAPEIRPLYNIPNILDASEVIWVEGEKCAETLNDLGFVGTCTLGGAGSLTRNNSDKFDFTPLRGKNVLVWPDNDAAGIRLAELVRELVMESDANSVTMLMPPVDKPPKWDVADAVQEGFDIHSFIKNNRTNVHRSINLLDDSLLVSRFSGNAPIQKFLVDGTLPIGVPVIFAAAGDSGKGMMTLDLGMKVASGRGLTQSFGGSIKEFGDVVIFTAEDDESEMHRRIEKLDPDNLRFQYPNKLHIVPLPNLGGVFPILKEDMGTYIETDEFKKIYQQVIQLKNLKLIVFDPLASFVHADVNSDPAAGASLTGLLSRLATETNATVLMCHHMSKLREDGTISKPEQARNMIRGTSALVDGVRCAFALWQIDEKSAKQRCFDLNEEYQRNRCYDGAVVKSNGPANREIRKFVRDLDTGLLMDRTDIINDFELGSDRNVRLNALFSWIESCEENGRALCQRGGADSVSARLDDNDAPQSLRTLSTSSIDRLIQTLISENKIAKYSFTITGGRKWLGTLSGAMSRGQYEATTARDNVE